MTIGRCLSEPSLHPLVHSGGFRVRGLPRSVATVVAMFCLANIALSQSHFTFTSGTGNNATVVVPASANPNIAGTLLASGDEIGVFTPGGSCVGAVAWNGSSTAIAVWGASTLPVMPGIQPGEAMSYRVWRKSTNTEFSSVGVSYSSAPPSTQWDGLYHQDALYVLSSLGTATKLGLLQQPTNAVAGALISPAIRVQIQDANGNVVPSDNTTNVTLAIGTNPGGGTLSGAATVTASSGIAAFSGLSINKTGTGYTLVATSTPSLTGATSSAFNVTAGAVSLSLTRLSVGRTSITSGDTTRLTLTAFDAYGNRLATGGLAIMFSLTGAGTSNGAIGTVTDNTDGTYSATLTGTTAGTPKTLSAGIGGSAVMSTLPTITVTPRKVAHGIALPPGWSMISSFVSPNNPTLDTVFAKVLSRLVIVKDGSGQVYFPSFFINQIQGWNANNGYQIYMQAADTLTISGNEIDPQVTPVALPPGWSTISYLRNSGMRTDSALSTLGGSLVIAKNNAGQVYYPSEGINDIGNMKPGQGYRVYLSSALTLTYPANTAGSAASVLTKMAPLAQTLRSQMEPKHYIPARIETGSNAILVVESASLENGDEVGVRGMSEALLGSGVVSNGKALITVWGDNSVTEREKEGAVDGERLMLTVWSRIGNAERSVMIAQISDGLTGRPENSQLVFKTDAIWIVQVGMETKLVPTVFSLEQCYPNPFNPSTTIKYSLPKDGGVTLEVYSLLGQRVATLVDGEARAGGYEIVFRANTLSSGVYLYTLRQGGYTATKKFVLLK